MPQIGVEELPSSATSAWPSLPATSMLETPATAVGDISESKAAAADPWASAGFSCCCCWAWVPRRCARSSLAWLGATESSTSIANDIFGTRNILLMLN